MGGDSKKNPNAPYKFYVDVLLTKYCTDPNNGYNGFVDKKNVLELEDDAAHVNWGGDWRMPTYYELRELLMNCSWVWCSNYNNSYSTGYKVTSKINGQFIFLPAAGIISYDGLIQARKSGTYWTSTLNQIDDYAAMALDFSQGYINSELNTNSRPLGMSVRPVLSRK